MNTSFPGLTGQHIEVSQSSIHRIYVFVIGNVVAEVDLRGGEARGNPDRIDAQIFQVIQLGRDSFQIADTIIVTISEAARINLVEDSVLPPLMAFRVHWVGGSLRGS